AGGRGGAAGVLAGRGGVVEAGEQAGPLGAGPGQRLLPAGPDGNPGRDPALRNGRGRAAVAADEGVSAGGGVLVVIQQPTSGILAVPVRVSPAGQGAGVLADQVMHPVPALSRFGQQVLVIQSLQAPARGLDIGAVQRGGGVAV